MNYFALIYRYGINTNKFKATDLITYNLGHYFQNKLEKPSKIGVEKKSLISTFACFLTAIAKV